MTEQVVQQPVLPKLRWCTRNRHRKFAEKRAESVQESMTRPQPRRKHTQHRERCDGPKDPPLDTDPASGPPVHGIESVFPVLLLYVSTGKVCPQTSSYLRKGHGVLLTVCEQFVH